MATMTRSVGAAITDAQRKEFVDALRELSTETGVDGVPRLVALFQKRHGDVGQSRAQLTSIAREALSTKAEKQVLTFPQSHSGGTVHASAKDQVWQADTASMYTFGDSPDTRGYFMIAVDVFALCTRRACQGGVDGRGHAHFQRLAHDTDAGH